MRGNNPIRKPLSGDGTSLEVQEIFPTLQGEGPYTGWPAVFIRLGGCNLACSFCDTEFESFEAMATGSVIGRVWQLASDPATRARIRHLVVITGGEPMRQPIAPLCQALLDAGFKVQIETNGTLWREIPEGVDIICSPKPDAQGYHLIRPDLLARVTAFKFLISAEDAQYSDVSEVGQTEQGVPVYVQPMDEYDDMKNQANLALTLQLAQRYGYRMSLQTHKILGVA